MKSIHIYEAMSVPEKKAQLRRWMNKAGTRLTAPSTKQASLMDYRDGTVDVIITECWNGRRSDFQHEVGIAVCPITLEEKKQIKHLWLNNSMYRRYKNMITIDLKTIPWRRPDQQSNVGMDAIAAECRRYIGGLLRRKECIHRRNLTVVPVRQPISGSLFFADDFEA